MIIDKVYVGVRGFSNKTQTGGYISPTRFNTYAEYAQLDIINELTELLGFNMRVATLISDVINVENCTVADNGYVNLPTDFYKYIDSNALFYDGGEFKESAVDYISKTERGERLRSKIVEPNNTYPIATEDSTGGLLIDPKTVNRIALTYVAEPPSPEWVGIGVPPRFDEPSSTDFVLSSKFQNILVYKICKSFAIEIKDSDLYNATTESLVREVGARR